MIFVRVDDGAFQFYLIQLSKKAQLCDTHISLWEFDETFCCRVIVILHFIKMSNFTSDLFYKKGRDKNSIPGWKHPTLSHEDSLMPPFLFLVGFGFPLTND